MTLPITPDRIVKIGHAFRGALQSAAELGVFTALGEGPLDFPTLTSRIGIHERGARDFFDTLVALRMLQRDENGCYANTPEADLLLDRRKDTYIGGEIERFGAYVYRDGIRQALRTGEPQSGSRATGHYSALYADTATLGTLAKGMTGGSLPVARALAAKFPWHAYRTVVDVGTAQGCLPVQIVLAHPHLLGGGFDLPPMRPHFERYIREHGRGFRGDAQPRLQLQEREHDRARQSSRFSICRQGAAAPDQRPVSSELGHERRVRIVATNLLDPRQPTRGPTSICVAMSQ